MTLADGYGNYCYYTSNSSPNYMTLWVPQLVYLFDGNDNGTHSGGFIFLTIQAFAFALC